MLDYLYILLLSSFVVEDRSWRHQLVACIRCMSCDGVIGYNTHFRQWDELMIIGAGKEAGIRVP